MKLSITFLVAGVFIMTSVRAQSLQEGVNDLYAERFKSAKATFEKLLAANPNNIEATYWLGQTYIATKDIPGARESKHSRLRLPNCIFPVLGGFDTAFGLLNQREFRGNGTTDEVREHVVSRCDRVPGSPCPLQ